MNPFPIDYAFQPRLRGRLTLGRLPLPRKPRVFGERVFHPSFRYSCLHPPFRPLQQPSPGRLPQATECSPTPPHPPKGGGESRGFGAELKPRYIIGA